MVHALDASPSARPVLAWRWKVDRVVDRADLARKDGDDFAARVYVFFDMPVESLGVGARVKALLARAVWGETLPTAALCYVWDNRHAPGTSAWNPYTDRVRTVVLRSGSPGAWARESRDLEADFRAAFGSQWTGPVPRVTGIADRQRHRPDGRDRHGLVRGLQPGGAAMKRLVLVGGGHAHVHVLKAIGDALDSTVSVTLVTPVERQVYSGMLPGFVAGHYALDECGIDLGALAERARALVVRSSASLVNPAMREVICANGEVVPYDVLSIDVGSRAFTGRVNGRRGARRRHPAAGALRRGLGAACSRARGGAA